MDYKDYRPEEFIQVVLNAFMVEKKSVYEIAKLYNADEIMIVRIVNQYNELKAKPINFIEDKRKQVDELKDSARKESEKITLDDIRDLQIDLGLFEKGKEPEIDKENE